jgi:SAM-dependent methyltransferase
MDNRLKKRIIYGLGKRYGFIDNLINDKIINPNEIIGVSDKKEKVVFGGFPFIERKYLNTVEFDEIVVTSDVYFTEISKELQNDLMIPKDKIVKLDGLVNELCFRHFHVECFKDLNGIEIGGPSPIFENNIYSICSSCDGVNYNADTVWWKQEQGKQYEYKGKKLGKVIIADATKLDVIENNNYDFCISSNNLEHIANPLKALKEFTRILKKDGLLLLLVPVKDSCFDHNREYTSFEHILDDYNKDVMENDLTHLDEILEKHDLSMDLDAGSFHEFKKRSLDNFNNRCLHHHVFCEDTLIKMLKYLDLDVIECGKLNVDYYILGGKIR